tara:strand:+ start:2537 stop:3862 length:1326 start_codon:yes stop_codon:yes gene_type:complete
MASTYSSDLKIELIADGEQAGTWGSTTNTNWQLAEEAISGKTTITISSAKAQASPEDIPVSEGASSTGRHAFIELKDAGSDLGSLQHFRLTPTNVNRLIFVRNSLTTQSAHIRQVTTFSTDTDEGLTLTNGETALLHFDGAGATTAKVIRVLSASEFSTLTTSGAATLNSAAVTNNLSVGGNITVTGTVDGVDVATLNSNFNSIFNSAEYVNRNAADTLTLIKGVDGTGSGLDADLLDGQEGSHYLDASNLTGTIASARLPSIDAATLDSLDSTQFLRSDAVDEIAAAGVPLSVNSTDSNANKIAFDDNGSVRGHIGASSSFVFIAADSSGTAEFTVDSSGNGVFVGDVTANSDIAFKSDIETLDGNKVFDMRGVSFMKDGRRGSGVVAQEIEKIAPELVHVGPDGKKSVAYGNLVGYLIEAVKDLQKELQEVKGGLTDKR